LSETKMARGGREVNKRTYSRGKPRGGEKVGTSKIRDVEKVRL